MNNNKKIKIFIVDDHQIVIDGICSLLVNEQEFHICGTCSDPTKVMTELQQHIPDIVVTDIQMPGLSGVELARNIAKKYPDTRILALSMFGDISSIRQMLDSGISGYVLKNTGREELIRALHTLAKGENYFSPEITRELATAVKSRTQHSAAHLTNREIEIIRLIARDLSNKQIAGELFISERTVETHRKNILRKTGNQTAIGLVKYAYDNKII